MRTYSGYLTDIPRIINNSQADNQTWAMESINDSIRYLVTRYYFNERSYTTSTVASQQFYNWPPQIKKLINVTISIGSVLWQPKECPSRSFWDSLNVISFTQDFPSYFFVYNGQIGIYPKPASNGNIITFNYKTRIVDLTMADITDATAPGTTTVTLTNNSTALTSSANLFANWMAGQWIRVPFNATNAASGDDQWYQIDSITNATTAVLKNPYTGPTVTAGNSSGTYIIGQVPILPEDYQDLPLYRMGILYYTTRFPDPTRAALYQKLWDEGASKLDAEYGSKTTNVVLNDTDSPMVNPNLFQSSLTQN